MTQILTTFFHYCDIIWTRNLNPITTPISNFFCPRSWLEKRIQNILAKNCKIIAKQQEKFDLDESILKTTIIDFDNIEITSDFIKNKKVYSLSVDYSEIDEMQVSNKRVYKLNDYKNEDLDDVKVGISSYLHFYLEAGNIVLQTINIGNSNATLAKIREITINQTKHPLKFLAIAENVKKDFFTDQILDDWQSSLIKNNTKEITAKGIMDSINQCFPKMIVKLNNLALAILIDGKIWCISKGRTRIVLCEEGKITQCTLENANFFVACYSIDKIKKQTLIIGSRSVFGNCFERIYGFNTKRIGNLALELLKYHYSIDKISATLTVLASPYPTTEKENTVIVASI